MNEFSDLERLAMRRALLIAMGGLYSTGETHAWVHVSSEMVKFFQKDFIEHLGNHMQKLRRLVLPTLIDSKDPLVWLH